jgi:hypothetical protein
MFLNKSLNATFLKNPKPNPKLQNFLGAKPMKHHLAATSIEASKPLHNLLYLLDIYSGKTRFYILKAQ